MTCDFSKILITIFGKNNINTNIISSILQYFDKNLKNTIFKNNITT